MLVNVGSILVTEVEPSTEHMLLSIKRFHISNSIMPLKVSNWLNPLVAMGSDLLLTYLFLCDYIHQSYRLSGSKPLRQSFVLLSFDWEVYKWRSGMGVVLEERPKKGYLIS